MSRRDELLLKIQEVLRKSSAKPAKKQGKRTTKPRSNKSIGHVSHK